MLRIDDRYRKLAETLVGFSINLQEGERVMINNIDTPDDITIALLEAVAKRGGVPFIKLQTSKVMRARNMLASEKSIKDISELSLNEMKQMDAFVAIRGGNNAFYSSDVPLIGKTNIGMFIEQTQLMHFVIVPSKGGGTNALLISPNSIEMKFGDFSFIKHIKQADINKFTPIVHDSFYMAMDVNTTEDLGEIIIHGDGTKTKEYLQSLNIHVRSVHGPERLIVERD